MDFYSISSLGRPLDPSYPTNRAVIVLIPILTALGVLTASIEGEPILVALILGARFGLAGFVSWALTREIDPDHDGSAFLSMALGTLAVFLLPGVNLLATFWLMALLRLLNRTSGAAARWLDTLVISGFSIWLAGTYDWLAGLIAGLIMLLDGFLADPLPRHRYLGAGLAVASLIGSQIGVFRVTGHTLSLDLFWVLIPALLFVPLLIHSNHIVSVGDVGGKTLDAKRIQAAQLVVFMSAIMLLTRRSDGVGASSLLIGSILGAALYFWGLILWQKLRSTNVPMGPK
jgi:hypothetical protein